MADRIGTMKTKTYKKRLSFQTWAELTKATERLKKQKKRFRIRGRLTKEQREYPNGPLWSALRNLTPEEKAAGGFFGLTTYNDFKLDDEPRLNQLGISIDHWDLYIY